MRVWWSGPRHTRADLGHVHHHDAYQHDQVGFSSIILLYSIQLYSGLEGPTSTTTTHTSTTRWVGRGRGGEGGLLVRRIHTSKKNSARTRACTHAGRPRRLRRTACASTWGARTRAHTPDVHARTQGGWPAQHHGEQYEETLDPLDQHWVKDGFEPGHDAFHGEGWHGPAGVPAPHHAGAEAHQPDSHGGWVGACAWALAWGFAGEGGSGGST